MEGNTFAKVAKWFFLLLAIVLFVCAVVLACC